MCGFGRRMCPLSMRSASQGVDAFCIYLTGISEDFFIPGDLFPLVENDKPSFIAPDSVHISFELVQAFLVCPFGMPAFDLYGVVSVPVVNAQVEPFRPGGKLPGETSIGVQYSL